MVQYCAESPPQLFVISVNLIKDLLESHKTMILSFSITLFSHGFMFPNEISNLNVNDSCFQNYVSLL